jgi:hypothetical protein
MTHRKLKRKWLLYSISGLLLIGFGLSLFGEAVAIKMAENAQGPWFWWGTASLVVFNSGLCIFGQAVVYRSRLN